MRELKPIRERKEHNMDSSCESLTELTSSSVNKREMEDVTMSSAGSYDTESMKWGESLEKKSLENAQRAFKEAVSEELEKLENMGKERSVAVVVLLQRIAGNPKLVTPNQEDVEKVIKLYGLSEEDAVRALIVKEELRRLKKGGMDGLAAVEELTRKMRNVNSNSVGMMYTSSSNNVNRAEADVEITTSGYSHAPANRMGKSPQQQVSTMKKNESNLSRKRCLGDESTSSMVLKRLRKFAIMKDPSHTSSISTNNNNNSHFSNTNANGKEKQVKDVPDCNNMNTLAGKTDALSVTATSTVKHSQPQPLGTSRKRNLKVTQSPTGSKRTRKNKL